MNELYNKLADDLYESELVGEPIEQISQRYPEFEIDDAYAIQQINTQRKIQNGRKISGKKIGLTSDAMMKAVGVKEPDYGILFSDMKVDSVVAKGSLIQPKVEGELAFILKSDLTGTITYEDVINATDYIVPAIEVCDSRIKDWKLKIVDTISDNASCGAYALGGIKIDPRKQDLKEIEMTLYQNGEFVNEGKGIDVAGDPVNAVVWLANRLQTYGVALNAGDVILSGSFTAFIRAYSGDEIVCDFKKFGKVTLNFE